MALSRKSLAPFSNHLLVATVLLLATGATAADWPTYRGDVRRSGVSPRTPAMPLAERWSHQPALAPRPAWPEAPARQDVYRKVYGLSPTVIFDRAPQPVVAGGRLYYGSSADDTVRCLDAASGKILWQFVTEGPVRLAPAVAGGRVYFGSDDGCVYCLEAADGSLRWKHRPVPADRRLPGNGRMMSLWPIRSGVIVDGGRAYFAAGLFPSRKAYLCAVDAATGQPVWRQQVDISPQGYLLASPTRLFVPTGRTAPHIYLRADGRQVAPFPGGGRQQAGFPLGGGCFGVLVDDVLVHAGGEKGGLEFTAAAGREKIIAAAGLRLVAQGEMAYVLDMKQLRAIHRARYVELVRLRQKKKKTPQDEARIAALEDGDQPAVLWQVPAATPYELILAGDDLLAGGDGRVVAFDRHDGRTVWQHPVHGKAYALAVADGRLYVGTDTGRISCFAHAAPEAAAAPATPRPSPPVDVQQPSPAGSTEAARFALAAAGTDRGYCLVLGTSRHRLLEKLAASSEFRLIGVEPDASKVAAMRRRLADRRLYGGRAVVHHGSPAKLPYQRRTFNLVVTALSDDAPQPATPAGEVLRLLRPCGGTAVVLAQDTPPLRQRLEAWGAGVLPGWKVQHAAEGLVAGVARRGPLDGAGQWTHFYADAGNSACSGDASAFGPMDVQWFGPPGPRRMVDRHEKNVGPLYRDGRMFISGNNYLVAVDAYNGTILWQRDLPRSIRLGAFKNCGSLAVAADLLYVARADTCVALDVASGEEKHVFPAAKTAGGQTGQWGYVATIDDLLLGSTSKPGANWRVQDIDTQTLIWRDRQPVVASDVLFAVDRHSGETRWTYRPAEGVIVNPTLAAGGGRVYCVQSADPKTFDVPDGRIKLDALFGRGALLVALDLGSGKIVWKRPIDLARLQHVVFLSYARQTLVITGSRNVSVPGSPKERVRYDLWAFDAPTGRPLWNSTQTPVPDHILQGPHGEQVQHSAIVGDVIYNTGFACMLRSGRPYPGWKWQKSDKCGTISASASCVFSRYVTPRMFSLATGDYLSLTAVTRPGCWINILPAGGMVLVPEASSGCTCYFSLQTSLALAPREDEASPGK